MGRDALVSLQVGSQPGREEAGQMVQRRVGNRTPTGLRSPHHFPLRYS